MRPHSDYYTDIVLVHTYKRVDFLYPQLTSFIKNQIRCSCSCNNHIVLFVVVDDSMDTIVEKKFLHEIEKVRQYINTNFLSKHWTISYWNKTRQKHLINAVGGEKFSHFFQDADSKKATGPRIIQNISQIISDYFVGKQISNHVLVHKIDDDIFPYSMSFIGKGKYQIKRIKGFFCQKRKFLERPSTRITGSYYTLDGPSPITDLFEVVEAIEIIFSEISKKQARNNIVQWQHLDKKLYIYGIPQKILVGQIEKQLKDLLNLSNLHQTDKLDGLLSQVVDNLSMFSSVGVNRFEYNLDNYAQAQDWSSERGVLPGGCISFKIDEQISPFPNFGDQDLLWSYLEHLKRGGVKGDFSILHVKTGAERSGFINAVTSGKETDFRLTFPITIKTQRALEHFLKTRGDNDALINFGGFGKDIVSQTKLRLQKIIKIIDGIILDDAEVSNLIKKKSSLIKNNLLPILANYDKVQRRYGMIKTELSDREIITRCHLWIDNEKQWFSLRQKTREIADLKTV